MLASGFVRHQRPEPVYFTIVATAFILYPFCSFPTPKHGIGASASSWKA